MYVHAVVICIYKYTYGNWNNCSGFFGLFFYKKYLKKLAQMRADNMFKLKTFEVDMQFEIRKYHIKFTQNRLKQKSVHFKKNRNLFGFFCYICNTSMGVLRVQKPNESFYLSDFERYIALFSNLKDLLFQVKFNN